MSRRDPAAPIWVVGTFDTKAAELGFLAGLLRARGVAVRTVDIGTRSSPGLADIAAEQVADAHPSGRSAVLQRSDRGESVIAMAEALARCVDRAWAAGEIGGMLGIGGSGGSSMIAPAMRRLPIGTPKLLVSTMAAGNVAPYVDVMDLMLMYPVTDLAGLNRLSRTVLANAAHAMAGMACWPAPPPEGTERPAVGLSMFGVTTPCVQAVRLALGERCDAQVFHANGPGGRALEALAAAGLLQALVDVTTTEVGQHLHGGVCDAGPGRLDAAARHGLPWVGSVGALDMVNFGPLATVPAERRGRRLHVHNADVTLMRTNADELQASGRRLAEQLNRAAGPVRLLLPLRGLSMLDAPGEVFHDPAADAALFDTLRRELRVDERRRLVEVDAHINDAAFATALVRALGEVLPAATAR
ncbi:Tm-1-like ATP-binding domain-containing protein [Piscinibacter sakaiensis]|uniref:Transcriptional regulator n=1 Tax=Piscinibacter sakaiensis TaxID=1547922 RepID=A0A0K8P5M4_PISS1|nr:Tm-1-like ATP-binding domain-containing protein [Piscinibacter sakaiensis]GAP38013.1 transcriptional regulator [Piscinibacter sakaiensis]